MLFLSSLLLFYLFIFFVKMASVLATNGVNVRFHRILMSNPFLKNVFNYFYFILRELIYSESSKPD